MKPPKSDNQTVKPWQKDLAAALKKASLSQGSTAEPNAALRAAIESLSVANKSNVAETLKKISAKQKAPTSNPALRAAAEAMKKTYGIPKAQSASTEWAKVARKHSGLKSKDLTSALQQIATVQKGSTPPTPTINRLIGLREPGLPRTLAEAHKKAFRAGLIHGMQETGSLNLNPWLKQTETEIFRNSAADALREDWMLIERDLWTTVEKMAQQLEELPPQTRVRLAKALAKYLQSHSVS